jgi:DNA polymerase-3 subunit beta
MKFSAQRESLLEPLQQVAGAVERRQTKPVLGNVLIACTDAGITLTATDGEIELCATRSIAVDVAGSITVPARKLLEICRHLPEQVRVTCELTGDKAVLKAGRSRFTLATLPAEQFPETDPLVDGQRITLPIESLREAMRSTAFSMAQQDVRFYLNGMLLEIAPERVCCVSTDGHRLAWSQVSTDVSPETPVRAIIPRKSVGELTKILSAAPDDGSVELHLTEQQLQVSLEDIRLTTRLVDGRFPDYKRVIPIDSNKELVMDTQSLRQSLTRASVLSNEKYRGIRLALASGVLTISSNNPEQEEAIDELEVDYQGEATEIGFNVTYLLEALGAIETESVRLMLKDSGSSLLMTPDGNTDCKYVVMPMRL